MRVRLLPSGGVGDPRGQYLTSFIINDSMAIDAGSLVLGINRLSQLLIRKVVITHSHLDHHVGLPLLLDNIFSDMSECVTVYSTEETIDALKNHIFNNLIWPDFSSFSNSNGASLKFEVVEPYRCFAVDELKLTLVPVNHTVPTVGLILEDRHSAIAISSDTGDTDEIWAIARELPNLKALFIECSYPNRLSRQADLYGHLCPESVLRQAQKVGRDVDVYVYHIKAAHVEEVLSEISALDSNRIVAADPMRVYEF